MNNVEGRARRGRYKGMMMIDSYTAPHSRTAPLGGPPPFPNRVQGAREKHTRGGGVAAAPRNRSPWSS